MTASNIPYLTAALIVAVCVPIGYTAHMGFERDGSPPLREPASLTLHEPEPRDPAEAWPDSELLAEWRRLHEIHGSGPESMPALFQSIQEIPETFRRRAFRAALVAEWAQLDPAGGFAFFDGGKDDAPHRWQIFDEWLKRDANAALDALMSEPKGWQNLARNQLKNIAREAPERIGGLVAQMPAPKGYWYREVSDAFEIVAAADLEKAKASANGFSGKNREQALSGIAKFWATRDAEAALAWARSLPEGIDHDEIIRHAIFGLAKVSPTSALEKVGLVPPGGSDNYFASTTAARALREASKTDFDATAAWLGANPGKINPRDITGIAEAVTDRLNKDTAGFLDARLADRSLATILPAINSALLNDSAGTGSEIWSWLDTQEHNETTASLRHEVMQSAGYKDPESVLMLAASLGDLPDSEGLMAIAVRSVLNHGQRANQLDYFLNLAAEKLHEPLINYAFDNLRSVRGTLENPERWVERIDSLPEDARPSAALNLSYAWTDRDPHAAAAWATTLPTGLVREQSIAGVASTWSGTDPLSASEWISSLPPGEDRDIGARSLSFSIVDTMPNEAWEWALSISDKQRQSDALGHVITKIDQGRHSDSVDLRSWIESSNLNTSDKSNLLQIVTKP